MPRFTVVLAALFLFIANNLSAQLQKSNLQFLSLPTRWDESLPLGNGMLGAMVWQKEDRLRFSLDCAALWDERPMKDLHRSEFSFKWVEEQYQKNNYAAVQKLFDEPTIESRHLVKYLARLYNLIHVI